jgi:hypothetical protein
MLAAMFDPDSPLNPAPVKDGAYLIDANPWAYGKGWPWTPQSFTRARYARPFTCPSPCGRTTPEMALRPFQGWPARRAGGLWPSSTPLDTPRHMPLFKSRRLQSHLGLAAISQNLARSSCWTGGELVGTGAVFWTGAVGAGDSRFHKAGPETKVWKSESGIDGWRKMRW